MRPRKDFTNKRFGKIVVLQHHRRNKNHSYWLCQCDCGTQKVLRVDCLKRNGIKSCGCLRRGPNNKSWRGIGEIHQSVLTRIQDDARIRKIKFDLTLPYLWELFQKQQKCCALSGDQIIFGRTCRDRNRTASVDRIDPSQGYVKGNVQWVHKNVNFAKQSMTQKDFVEMCRKISSHALVAQMDEHHGPNVKDAGSTPARSTNL